MIRAALALLAVPSLAYAEHDMAAMDMSASEPASEITASLSLEAASYETLTYEGSYQGVLPGLDWMHGRFGAGANLGLYHIVLNGLDTQGIGDLMLHGHALLYTHGPISAGAMMMVSVPTGDDEVGLGMGHVMVMPALFATLQFGRVALTANGGFTRALASVEQGHDHGVWPLVDPMNMSEVSWSADGDVSIGYGVHTTANISGGIPVGLIGHDRVPHATFTAPITRS